jgi:hypothetical protein
MKDKLQMIFIKVTDRCKGLILDLFFKEKSMELIQKKYGYTTAKSLATQKHKCMEQIRKINKINQ